ncbi:hypothetical protein IMCC21224_112959 [Puniceibacterium sp. IMCC21224]|nr:hypothetical protein IMCC21224_112959 [Puniceibacterium sp. IMCC21224]
MKSHVWVIEVLQDLTLFAAMNGLDETQMDLPRKSSGLSAHVRRPSLESQGTFPAKG